MARRRFSRAMRAGCHLKAQYTRHSNRLHRLHKASIQTQRFFGHPSPDPQARNPRPGNSQPRPNFPAQQLPAQPTSRPSNFQPSMGPASATSSPQLPAQQLPSQQLPARQLGGSGCDHNLQPSNFQPGLPAQQLPPSNFDSSRRGNNCNQSSTKPSNFQPSNPAQQLEPATNGKRIAAPFLQVRLPRSPSMHRQPGIRQPDRFVRHSRFAMSTVASVSESIATADRWTDNTRNRFTSALHQLCKRGSFANDK